MAPFRRRSGAIASDPDLSRPPSSRDSHPHVLGAGPAGRRCFVRPLIADSRAAARLFAGERWPEDREVLLVARFDGSRRVLDVTRYESGAVDEVLVAVRAIVAACAARDS